MRCDFTPPLSTNNGRPQTWEGGGRRGNVFQVYFSGSFSRLPGFSSVSLLAQPFFMKVVEQKVDNFFFSKKLLHFHALCHERLVRLD